MRWVVIDLEATCWSADHDAALAADQRNECEVIEIGAVQIEATEAGYTLPEPARTFRACVRPRRHPQLSAFCTELTGITQADVDAAPPFPESLAAFLDWAGGDDGLVLASWGAWDDRQLRRDAERWGLPEPRWQAFNVRRLFVRRARTQRMPRGGWMGLAGAIGALGGSFVGRQHDALDDARNTAWLLSQLPKA